MSDSSTRDIGGFLLGAALGAGLVYLFAPASGKETRRRIAARAQSMGTEAQHALGGLTESMTEGVHAVGTAVEEGRKAFRREVDGAMASTEQH